MPDGCITLGVHLVKPNWLVSLQATIAHIAEIRHRGHIWCYKKDRVLRRIREQNTGGFLPLWAPYPMVPYPNCKAIIYCYSTENICNKRSVMLNKSFASRAIIEMVQ